MTKSERDKLIDELEREPDHWTFKDDPEKEPRPGWGPFKFDFMFKNAEDIVKWHDLITTAKSFAQRVGIPSDRVAQHFRDMLELRNEELAKKGRISGLRGIGWKLSSRVVQVIHHLFYEGKIK